MRRRPSISTRTGTLFPSTTLFRSPAAHSPYLTVRNDWLARRAEPALEPDLPIVDPHHHLWDRPHWRYLLDDLLADTNQGHNVVATVFVQCRAFHRAGGPEDRKSTRLNSSH